MAMVLTMVDNSRVSGDYSFQMADQVCLILLGRKNKRWT